MNAPGTLWGQVLAGASVLALVMGIGRFAYTPMLPPMMAEGGLSLAAAGYVASANFLGYLIGALIVSRGDFGNQRAGWLRVAIIASVASTAAMALDAGAWGWSLLRFAGGVASAVAMICTSAIVLELLSQHRRPMLGSVLYAGVGIGIALSALVVHLGLRASLDAGALWWVLALASAAMALAPLRVLGRPLASGPPEQGTRTTARAMAQTTIQTTTRAASAIATVPDSPNAAVRARALRLLILGYGCLGFGYVITATFIVVIVRGLPDPGAWEFWAWMTVGLTGAPSNLVWQAIALRIGTYAAIAAALLIEAAGVALVATASGPAGILLGAAFLGGTFMAITALGLAAARELAPHRANQTIGLMTAAFGLGQIIGPSIGGWLAERSGNFLAASWLAAAVLIGGAIATAIAGVDLSRAQRRLPQGAR